VRLDHLFGGPVRVQVVVTETALALRSGGYLSVPLINPPVRLSIALKRLVQLSISEWKNSVDEEEFEYVADRIAAKLDVLRDSSQHWVRDLWLIATAFSLALDDHKDGRAKIPPDVLRLIVLGLHYVVNPFDIIPDHMTDDGYIDDAFVLNECVRQITRINTAILPRYVRVAKRSL
jgi:uncharacterized membrane protein YkvA (DUF1232 family)